jgi:hypothetical protein
VGKIAAFGAAQWEKRGQNGKKKHPPKPPQNVPNPIWGPFGAISRSETRFGAREAKKKNWRATLGVPESSLTSVLTKPVAA